MSVHGSYQDLDIVAGHQWVEGVLSGFAIQIAGPPRQDAEDCFALVATDDSGLGESDLETLDSKVAGLLRPALLGARRFSSGECDDRLVLPYPCTAAQAKEKLAVVARFADLRRTGAGPYR